MIQLYDNGLNMAKNIYMPSLSEDGWVMSSIKIIDYALSHFFLSDYSQTYIYKDQVSSLPYIIQSNNGDISKTIETTKKVLEKYFLRYFPKVIIEVNDVTKEATKDKGEISLYINITDNDGIDHIVGKLIGFNNLIITKVIDINNG